MSSRSNRAYYWIDDKTDRLDEWIRENPVRFGLIVFFAGFALLAILLQHFQVKAESELGALMISTIVTLGPEVAGIVIGVVTIDYLNERRQREQLKQQLIRQMGLNIRDAAVSAARELAHHGWLQDGSLNGANLQGAILSRADLKRACLRGVNLREADLRGADLDGANLSMANLFVANIGGALLRQADLNGANLMFSNLKEANLYKAILSGTRLENANLSETNLFGADLSRANLRETNMSWAKVGGVTFQSKTVELGMQKGFYTEDVFISADMTAAEMKRTDMRGISGIDWEQLVIDHDQLEAVITYRRWFRWRRREEPNDD